MYVLMVYLLFICVYSFDNDDQIREIFDKYNNKNHHINNIEYLGCGYSYDHVKRYINNFKSPIIQNYENMMDIQDEFICDISIEKKNIENKQELVKKVFTHNKDSSWSAYSSYNNQEFINDSLLDVFNKYTNLLIKKYKCIVYKANLTLNTPFGTNSSENSVFFKVLDSLYENCNHRFYYENCPISMYKKNALNPNCIKCMLPWVQFFNDYGIYMTKQITMGGIINKFYNIDKYEGDAKKEYKKTTIKESSTFFNLTKYKSEEKDQKSSSNTDKEHLEEVYTLSIGPEPPGSKLSSKVIAEWLEEVIENPTPIDFELVAIKEIIPNEYIQIYSDALDYYTKLNNGGKSLGQMESSNNMLINILKYSKNVVKVLNTDEKHVKVCTGEDRAMIGFCMSMNLKGELLQIQLLNNKLNVCIFSSNTSSVSMWALCTKNQIQDYKQLVYRYNEQNRGNNELKCPNNMSILYGFIVNVKNPSFVKICKPNVNACSGAEININGFIWAFCIPKNTININFVKSILRTGTSEVDNKCPNKYKLVQGMKFLFNPESESGIGNLTMEPCDVHINNCNINCKQCSYVASLIICTIY